jgi:CubicO group peptidase (beta-lactamase class C family)
MTRIDHPKVRTSFYFRRSIRTMRILLRSFIIMAALIGVLIAVAYATGNDHLIRGLRFTYLIGRKGPQIDDRHLLPTTRIKATDPQPWPQGSRYGKLEFTADQEHKLNELHSVGFVIVQDDSLIFEKYWEGWGPDSVVNSFSVAKSHLGLLTGIALKEGVIKSLDQKVGDLLPEFNQGCHAEISIWHLLTMSAGLDWSESSADPFSDNAKAYYGHSVRKLSLEQPCRTTPGQEFDYISGATQILAEALEKAYGTTLDQLVEVKIWGSLGAEHDAWWGLDDEGGDLKAFCCLYATNRDFARLGQVYLDSGMWRGRQIIDRDYWHRSIRPAPLRDRDRENRRYGLHWWIAEFDGRPIHYARGINGQYVIVIPHDKLVVVRTGMERGSVNDDGHPVDLFEWIRIAMEVASDSGGPHIAAAEP